MVKKYNEIEAKNNMKVEVDVEVEETEAPKERKQLEKIVSVQPKKVKRGLMGRLVEGVLGPEGLPGIGTYVNEEIIKPAIKNLIFDAITSAASRAMYGRNGGPARPSNQYNRHSGHSSHRPVTNYSNRYSSSSGSSRPEPEERKVRPARYGVDDFKFEDRYDASNVLVSLTEAADRYDNVSIADYYDMIGVESVYTDHTYGWTIDTITQATIVPVRGGYIIKFPQVEVI